MFKTEHLFLRKSKDDMSNKLKGKRIRKQYLSCILKHEQELDRYFGGAGMKVYIGSGNIKAKAQEMENSSVVGHIWEYDEDKNGDIYRGEIMKGLTCSDKKCKLQMMCELMKDFYLGNEKITLERAYGGILEDKIKINKADQNCNRLHKKQCMLLNKGNDSEGRNKFGNQKRCQLHTLYIPTSYIPMLGQYCCVWVVFTSQSPLKEQELILFFFPLKCSTVSGFQ